MKTRKMLWNRQMMSYFYLVLASGFVFLAIIPTPFTKNWIFPLEISPFVLIMAGICLVHFYFGALYYPGKYEKHLDRKVKISSSRPSFTDLSNYRGYIVTATTIALLWTFKPGWDLALISFIWLVISFFLNDLTRTDKLFSLESVTINEGELLPGGEKSLTLHYLYPKNEDLKKWENLVILDYLNRRAKELRDYKDHENEVKTKKERKTDEIKSALKEKDGTFYLS